MCLFMCGLGSNCARLPDFSGGATPSVAVTLLLASVVQACVSGVSLGSYSRVLIALFGWFVGLFSTYVRGRDVSKHTQ